MVAFICEDDWPHIDEEGSSTDATPLPASACVDEKKNKPRLTRQPDNIYERVVETSKAGLNRTFTSQKSFGDKL